MDDPSVPTLVQGLISDSDSTRKYAVFKLQALLSDPSFADAFLRADGLLALRHAVLETSGNTQAYALGGLDRLLELDMGWEVVDAALVARAVGLAATDRLVNVVRNALTLLVLVVSRPGAGARGYDGDGEGVYGFRAVKPALDAYPTFLESLVQRLSASDHLLCANALQLVNALMRDAVVHGGEHEWPRFIKRLQDLGVIGGVGMLMRGDAANDAGSPLAAAILEFQGLTKVLLRRWREVRVNVELHEHKKALKTMHLLSKPEPYNPGATTNGEGGGRARRHHPEKWRRLGFETESPMWEFDETGYLGMMDLVDFAKRNEDAYQKMLMEQAVQALPARCPVARASLSVTLILYEHFEIDAATPDMDGGGGGGVGGHRDSLQARVLDARATGNLDRLYRPLLLQWGRLHTAATNAFFRLWKAAGAEADDFFKIEELVRIVVERVVGAATRKTDVGRVEELLRGVGLERARAWQMEALDEVYEDAWGPHLGPVRELLQRESLQFMREQRVRCLLQGAWFPAAAGQAGGGWRFVRLHSNRRWLHYAQFAARTKDAADGGGGGGEGPAIADLPHKIDLNTVTSVDSNVSAADAQPGAAPVMLHGGGANSSSETLKESRADSIKPAPPPPPQSTTNTKITIYGTQKSYKTPPSTGRSGDDAGTELVLLELHAGSAALASEWLDGLLMLLNQQPITQETTRLVDLMVDWGVRLRMLNLRWEDVDWERLEASVRGQAVEGKEVPGRDGVEGEEFWYALPET